jgi:hypothetical protein
MNAYCSSSGTRAWVHCFKVDCADAALGSGDPGRDLDRRNLHLLPRIEDGRHDRSSASLVLTYAQLAQVPTNCVKLAFRPPAPIERRDTMGLLKLRPMRLVILVDCRDISDVLSHLKPARTVARLEGLRECIPSRVVHSLVSKENPFLNVVPLVPERSRVADSWLGSGLCTDLSVGSLPKVSA